MFEGHIARKASSTRAFLGLVSCPRNTSPWPSNARAPSLQELSQPASSKNVYQGFVSCMIHNLILNVEEVYSIFYVLKQIEQSLRRPAYFCEHLLAFTSRSSTRSTYNSFLIDWIQVSWTAAASLKMEMIRVGSDAHCQAIQPRELRAKAQYDLFQAWGEYLRLPQRFFVVCYNRL